MVISEICIYTTNPTIASGGNCVIINDWVISSAPTNTTNRQLLEKTVIPKMTVQPLIENACKHGIQSIKGVGFTK